MSQASAIIQKTKFDDIDIAASIKFEKQLKRYISEYLLPQRFINAGKIFKIPKVIGLVGPWGSGKSLTGAGLTILDFMIRGIEVYSNMEIKFFIRVGNLIAAYHSQPLNRADLFKLQIKEGLIYCDEVNIEFAEGRRSMTNKNLKFAKVLQMIRKKKCNMIYTVINEMFVEQRLREMTSIFIKCNDVLLQPGGLYQPYDFGERIHWRGYDMMGILGQGSFYDSITKEPSFELTLNAKTWFNTYDTDLVQGEDIEDYSKYEVGEKDVSLETKQSPQLVRRHQDWEWLELIAEEMLASGRETIPVDEIFFRPEVKAHNITKVTLSKELNKRFHIEAVGRTSKGKSIRVYSIPEMVLS